MAFRYQKRTYADAKERRDSRGGNYDSYVKAKYKLYKVKDGKNLIRILPPTWPKAKHYGLSVFLNYGIGPDNATYLSLSKMLGKPDPIAEARSEADRAGDEELTKALQPRERVLLWVIDREAEEEGPQIWPCPKTADSDILSISTDDDTQDLIEIDHPDEGQDLRFYKEGKGLNTKYPAAKMRLMKPAPLNEDEKVQQQWLEYIEANPLTECLQYYDYDHIAAVYSGTSKDEEANEKPRRAKREEPDEEADEKPRRSRREEPDEEAEEKAEEQPRRAKREDPEDEPEEKPKRLAKRDEPDEEAESEERPRRNTKREEPDEEVDEKPRPRARLKDSEPEDEEVEEKPAKKGAKPKDDDEGMSIRDRLRKRRAKADDDEE